MSARPDFSDVTEVAGSHATAEQLAMIHTRYALAAELSARRRVLEVACGPGRGLGLLARHASFLVGGDLTFGLLRDARRHYGSARPLVQLDAQSLPFASRSFDVVIMFEAIYYVPDVSAFLAECRRVLRSDGVVLLCSANREWEGFAPSPFSSHYYSASELRALLLQHGFSPEIRVGFPANRSGSRARVLSAVRRLAVRSQLIPRTLAGRELLKRLFYGRLTMLAPEIDVDDDADGMRTMPAPAPDGPVANHKVLYVWGRPAKAAHAR